MNKECEINPTYANHAAGLIETSPKYIRVINRYAPYLKEILIKTWINTHYAKMMIFSGRMIVPLPLILIGIVLVLLILFLRRNYGTLENCGFPVIPPTFCFGSGPFMMHKHNLAGLDQKRFEKYGKVWGAYVLSNPTVYIADPEMIKQIFIKDFDHFLGHGFRMPQKYRSLSTTTGEEWTQLRKGLTPVFTSGKIKGMMQHVDGVVENMINYLHKKIETDPVVDMRPVFKYYTMDVISKCAFGVDLNCFEDPNNPMLVNSVEAFFDYQARDTKSSLLRNFAMLLDGIDRLVDLPMPATVENLWNITKKIQTNRSAEKTNHENFIDRLAELKKQLVKPGSSVTEDQLTAQGIVFFTAGFDTSANSLGVLSYYLVNNPEVYGQLMQEVNERLEDYDGKVGYEMVAEMPYLEACVKEALRMSAPVARGARACNKDWEYKGIKIKKGTKIGIPFQVVHKNPEYWPEPELFRPERFLKENANNIVPCSFLPFGEGPRACIGERFAIVEIKVAMARLLQEFTLAKCEKTKLKLEPGDLFMNDYKEMHIQISPRN